MRTQFMNLATSLPLGGRLIENATGKFDTVRRGFNGEEGLEEGSHLAKAGQVLKSAVVKGEPLLSEVQRRTVAVLRRTADKIEQITVPSKAVAEAVEGDVVEAGETVEAAAVESEHTTEQTLGDAA